MEYLNIYDYLLLYYISSELSLFLTLWDLIELHDYINKTREITFLSRI